MIGKALVLGSALALFTIATPAVAQGWGPQHGYQMGPNWHRGGEMRRFDRDDFRRHGEVRRFDRDRDNRSFNGGGFQRGHMNRGWGWQ